MDVPCGFPRLFATATAFTGPEIFQRNHTRPNMHSTPDKSSFRAPPGVVAPSSVFLRPLSRAAALLGVMAGLASARAQLISENFSSGAGNFTVVSGGTWAVSAGKYVLSAPAAGAGCSGNGNISTHNTTVSGDFTLTVDASVTATSSAFNDFSVLFGYQNSTNYYFVSFNESNDSCTSGIFKVAGGVLTQLADITSLIAGGTTYAVKIEKTGSTYKAYRNNVLLATATDATWSSGKVGFGTLNDGASYDNLVVTLPPVAAPVFNPGGGTYSSAQSVAITSATSGATIRYTTNGSTPSQTNGTIYSSPVSISSTTTLKAIAYKSGMADSTVTTATYTINLPGYYCDPVNGSMSNPGTSASPWSTLQAVFAAGKTFVSGDVIYLRDGNHGAPVITGNIASGNVTVIAQAGHSPVMSRLTMNGTRWIVSKVTVTPEVNGSYSPGGQIVRLNGSNNTIRESQIYSGANSSGWTLAQWQARAMNGIYLSGSNHLATQNTVKNVYNGIVVLENSPNCTVSFNSILDRACDGMRGLSNGGRFEYNYLDGAIGIDTTHRDMFQSWQVSGTSISGVIIRGNVMISATNPTSLTDWTQGIGCFDGWYDDWIIENNIVVTDHFHGITLEGARNCRIVNNTVMKNPLNLRTQTPWIRIANHSSGSQSFGNTIRNNLTTDLNNVSGVGTVDFNIETTAYTTHFVNYAAFDFHLKATSPAVNAGTTSLAPTIDYEQQARVAPYDIGADER